MPDTRDCPPSSHGINLVKFKYTIIKCVQYVIQKCDKQVQLSNLMKSWLTTSFTPKIIVFCVSNVCLSP